MSNIFNANDNRAIDILVPFIINDSNYRGKIVRLGLSLNEILSKHRYPTAIGNILSELLVIVTMIGDSIKHEGGKVTAQIESKGLVKLLIADYFYGGKIRGYCKFDEEEIKERLGEKIDFSDLCKDGYIVVTIDLGSGYDRYQGVVELLNKGSISDALEEYFRNSEQVNTSIKVETSSNYNANNNFLIAGGIMLQSMPDGEGLSKPFDEVSMFMQTLSKEELTNPNLALEQVLFRLYHETGVWVHEARPITHGCMCSREKAENAVEQLPIEERNELLKTHGAIEVKCEFCGKVELFK